MADIVKKSLNTAESVQTPEKLKNEIVTVNGIKIQRVTVYPGWKWSDHLKPVVGGDSCQVDHLLYIVSGTLQCQMTGGTIVEFKPGDVGHIPAGHDGWTVGSEPVVWLEIPH